MLSAPTLSQAQFPRSYYLFVLRLYAQAGYNSPPCALLCSLSVYDPSHRCGTPDPTPSPLRTAHTPAHDIMSSSKKRASKCILRGGIRLFGIRYLKLEAACMWRAGSPYPSVWRLLAFSPAPPHRCTPFVALFRCHLKHTLPRVTSPVQRRQAVHARRD
ncbi:hypothetical protein HYPSUDRAFT_67177 [Hypholoma sublateritium FD-334 SS-4]|uniref:Uncharacterized protein n=1 Tax=Hypholoma sublateritium (strain FD-334 SS-4) TaxID=945553 RepID=A0A0D2NTZ2_HYPSF|nr:hypothetical protein HYPSUDRAFT_67177 [Hypholoma sublateritium FD-334 SS-4]